MVLIAVMNFNLSIQVFALKTVYDGPPTAVLKGYTFYLLRYINDNHSV